LEFDGGCFEALEERHILCHPAYVFMTKEGIAKCNEPEAKGSWNSRYFSTD
jgi:hypothetical protein